MKKAWLIVTLLLISCSYVLAEIIRIEGSNQNTNINEVQIYSTINNITNSPHFGENITIRINITDERDTIQWTNVTLINPSNIRVIDNVNATKFVDWWNSTTYILNESGTYTYQIITDDNNTLNLTFNNYTSNFTIVDNLYMSEDNITEVMPTEQNNTYTIELYTNSRQDLNFTINHTINKSNFNVTLNTTYVTINNTRYRRYLRININSSSVAPYGNNTGNITINRQAPFTRNFSIPVRIEISSQYGDIEHVSPADYQFSSCGGTIEHSINVVNNGNYILTNCHAYLYDEDLNEVSTSSDFNLAAGVQSNASIVYQYSGSDNITTYFGVRCIASPGGSYDYTSNDPMITFIPATSCQGSQGGGGVSVSREPSEKLEEPKLQERTDNICGNDICEHANGENPWKCPQDCLVKILELDEIICWPIFNCGNWDIAWFSNSVIIGTTGLLIWLLIIKPKKLKIKRPI